jgi:hypothetical protein
MQGPGGVQEDPSDGFERGGWLVPHSDAGQLDPVDGWFRQADALLLGSSRCAASSSSRAVSCRCTAVGGWRAPCTTPGSSTSTAVSLTLRQAEFGTTGTGEFVVSDGREAIA